MQPKTLTLLRRVREDPATQLTSFIMMTAESKVEYAAAAKKAGVDDYIVKPFTAQTLKAKIEDVFAAKVTLTSSSGG
jgi:two-component system, chemotaxis family, chemotaxis protein CheY